MLNSAIPTKFPIPFANNASGSYIRNIPQASQIGIQNGAASLTDGFPPACFSPIASGGSWPFGQDFNGIVKQITQWLQWAQAGGPITYDSGFCSSIGGYPYGAMLLSGTTPGLIWINTTDNNTSNPDSGGANWTTIYALAHTWTALQTFNAGVALPNNAVLSSKDTGGTVRSIIGLLSDNYLHLASGPAGFVLTDITGAIGFLTFDTNGNATVRGTLNAGNNLTATRGLIAGAANSVPKLSDFPSSPGATGWKKYPDANSPSGYFIEQWGNVAAYTGGGIYTNYFNLPIVYPSAHITAVAQFNGNTPPPNFGIAASPYAPNSIAITMNGPASNNGVCYFSKGY